MGESGLPLNRPRTSDLEDGLRHCNDRASEETDTQRPGSQESPLNILEDVPNSGGQFNYSPMWDIHLVQWNDSVPVASLLRQTDFARAEALVGTQAQSIAPDGSASNAFQATGFIVDCPLISIFANK